MKKIISILILVMTFLSGALLLWAITLPPQPPIIVSSTFYTCSTNFYVRPTGNDSNDGSADNDSHAWASVSGSIANLIGTNPANLNQSGVCVNFDDGTYIGDVSESPANPWSSGTFSSAHGSLGIGGTSGTSNQLVFRSINLHGAILHIPYTTTDATNFHGIFSFGLLNQYTFTIPSNSMKVNDVYSTPDGNQCTILSTTTSSTTVYATCNGIPDTVVSGSNTLTQVSGTGPAGPLTYSVVTGGWLGGNIVIDGFDMEGNGGIWWTTGSSTTTTGDVYKDQGGNLYTVKHGLSSSTTQFTDSLFHPVTTFTLSAPASVAQGTVFTNLNGSEVTVTCTVPFATNSNMTLLANCNGTVHNATSTLNNAGGNLTYTAASNTSGVLTFVSGNGGSSASITYTLTTGANDCGIVTGGSGLIPMSHLTAINNIANYFGSVGIGGNHYDYFTAEGNLITNSATIGNQTSAISLYEDYQTNNLTPYHNILEWNVLHDNMTTAYVGFQHTDGNNIIIDDFQSTQNSCATSPTLSIVASSGGIQSATSTGGTSCEVGDILYVNQSGAYGGQFLVKTVTSGVPTSIQEYTPGTGYTTASGLTTTHNYGTSEGQGGTMTITVSGGGLATCSSSGGAGYINGNIVLITQTGGSSGECQVATNISGVPSTWTVYNPGKGYTAASGLAVVNLADKYTLIQNNLVYRSGGAGIRAFESDGVVVINNTNYANNMDTLGNSTTGFSAGIMASVSHSDIFSNNISYTIIGSGAQAANTAYSDIGGGVGNLWFNNLSYNGTTGQNSFSQSGSDLSGTTLSGNPYNNYLGVNPSFNSISTFDFTPSSTFPSQDAGINTFGYPISDLVGTSTNASSITLGAYQYTTVVPTPSTPSYVIYS